MAATFASNIAGPCSNFADYQRLFLGLCIFTPSVKQYSLYCRVFCPTFFCIPSNLTSCSLDEYNLVLIDLPGATNEPGGYIPVSHPSEAGAASPFNSPPCSLGGTWAEAEAPRGRGVYYPPSLPVRAGEGAPLAPISG